MAKILVISVLFWLSACGVSGNSPTTHPYTQPEVGEALSAGQATGFRLTAGAFSEASSNMTFARKAEFLVGNDFFEDPWVIAPSSTTCLLYTSPSPRDS